MFQVLLRDGQCVCTYIPSVRGSLLVVLVRLGWVPTAGGGGISPPGENGEPSSAGDAGRGRRGTTTGERLTTVVLFTISIFFVYLSFVGKKNL